MKNIYKKTPKAWNNVILTVFMFNAVFEGLINNFPIEGDFKVWLQYLGHPILSAIGIYAMNKTTKNETEPTRD